MMKKLLLIMLFAPLTAFSATGLTLDKAQIDLHDTLSLQRGARVFVNYCLTCHSASSMRYNRLQDLGLTELQIKDNLVLTEAKVGETMRVAMDKKDSQAWFGATPPDLSVIARSRGADWLYTYLRSFYRSESRPTGWDNLVFNQVGMPHVLYELQGVQTLKIVESTDSEGRKHFAQHLVLEKPGTLSKTEYDSLVRDLVNYMVYMGEPAQVFRKNLGIFVLLFLGLLFIIFYALKREYWKDIH